MVGVELVATGKLLPFSMKYNFFFRGGGGNGQNGQNGGAGGNGGDGGKEINGGDGGSG